MISFELLGIVIVSLSLRLLGFGTGTSGLVAVLSSTVAMAWNYVWTTLFEAWAARQDSQTRTVRRRIVHTLGFEGGLVLILVPLIAWVLSIPLTQALLLELGLLAFFLVYTFVFAWAFDQVLPPHRTRAASTARSGIDDDEAGPAGDSHPR